MYFIKKACRISTSPYSSSSCGKAGIEPGQFYLLEIDAIRDARKLQAVNIVGWTVVKVSYDEVFTTQAVG